MAMIGMAEAAKRLGMSQDGARVALQRAGVHLIRIGQRALAVEERDLARFAESRAGYSGRGRPRKARGES